MPWRSCVRLRKRRPNGWFGARTGRTSAFTPGSRCAETKFSRIANLTRAGSSICSPRRCRTARRGAPFSRAIRSCSTASDEAAHPGGCAHRAAEAVEMNADHVARLALAVIARDRHELIARIGVGHEAGDAAAEAAQCAQRRADAAALRVAQERRR